MSTPQTRSEKIAYCTEKLKDSTATTLQERIEIARMIAAQIGKAALLQNGNDTIIKYDNMSDLLIDDIYRYIFKIIEENKIDFST
jgi:hypothetical protein